MKLMRSRRRTGESRSMANILAQPPARKSSHSRCGIYLYAPNLKTKCQGAKIALHEDLDVLTTLRSRMRRVLSHVCVGSIWAKTAAPWRQHEITLPLATGGHGGYAGLPGRSYPGRITLQSVTRQVVTQQALLRITLQRLPGRVLRS